MWNSTWFYSRSIIYIYIYIYISDFSNVSDILFHVLFVDDKDVFKWERHK